MTNCLIVNLNQYVQCLLFCFSGAVNEYLIPFNPEMTKRKQIIQTFEITCNDSLKYYNIELGLDVLSLMHVPSFYIWISSLTGITWLCSAANGFKWLKYFDEGFAWPSLPGTNMLGKHQDVAA